MSIERINFCENEDFKSKYKSASFALNKEQVILEMLIDTYNDEKQMTFIKMANDYFEYAPVYSWLKYNKDKIEEYCSKQEGGVINKELKKAIGAFWAWVMQYDPVNNISIRWRKRYNKTEKQDMRKTGTFKFRTATLYKCE